MDTRRSFLKKAGMLSGGAGMLHVLPATLAKALAINPEPGSTFYDAEHIVFLMQENRSFDHAFGSLQGVRGFNDPRAINLPNNNKVWLQTNAKGETYAPFPLDIKNSKITWMGSLPHGWTDQVDARNGGKMDAWLEVKDPGDEYAGMPITMGYYNREDIPFYYALADAFTVCDQNFCSVLAGTTPNRLYFWSGTIREKMEADAQANVWNQDADHGQGEVHWKTYPERLEDAGISWKVYQNELYLDVGLGDDQAWLDNFGDNPLEYFTHYNARMLPEYIKWLPEKIKLLEQEITGLQQKKENATEITEQQKLEKTIASRNRRLAALKQEQITYTKENYDKLSEYQKNIYQKAFTTNRNDPNYHKTTKLNYDDGNTNRELDIPKGDVLHQFREDVNNGKLPTVSWLAAPEHFSDHPSSAWFGAWYVSEVMDILTKNPEVWKKTIFVLTYDENDGYFDHVPPFGAPDPYSQNTGKVSEGIDSSVEFVKKSQQSSQQYNRESNIGLGFRVPMVIASPWTRGGYVCSQVFDHTSSLQFLEDFLQKKTGKKITEENISTWRRAVCGNLTSAFRPYLGEKINLPAFIKKEPFIQSINDAKFKGIPNRFKALSKDEIAAVNLAKANSLLPHQERGNRPACPIPYEMYVNGSMAESGKNFKINFEASNNLFKSGAAGVPFYVYAKNGVNKKSLRTRDYAVAAGSQVTDEWNVDEFENGLYNLTVHGPNGFYRIFKGQLTDPRVQIDCRYETKKTNSGTVCTGNLLLVIQNNSQSNLEFLIKDNSYKTGSRIHSVTKNSKSSIVFNLSNSSNWYDLSVTIKGFDHFLQQFAGHVETGKQSKTDPLMGGIL